MAGLEFVVVGNIVVCLVSSLGGLEVDLAWRCASGRGVGIGNADGWV